jgi:hypothetical protein
LHKRLVVSCALQIALHGAWLRRHFAHPLLCTSPLSFGDILALPCCWRPFDLFQPTYVATEETTGERKQAVSWPPAACKGPELGPTMSLGRPSRLRWDPRLVKFQHIVKGSECGRAVTTTAAASPGEGSGLCRATDVVRQSLG